MNRKLSRLLRPGAGVYFLILAAFCAATLLEGHYLLAVVETSVTLLIFMLYITNRNRRERQIQKFLQEASNTLEATSHGEGPLPAVLTRLGDGGIIWANHWFSEVTGYADTMMEQQLNEVLPDFSMEWLASGKTECPQDVTMNGRRYRVYGTTLRADDHRGTMLGILYFVDLTELYQIRDE